MTERKTQEKFKEGGITLIALVITIIVLLILAGVALSALTGDSGILSNAEKAKEKTGIANEKEIIGLAAQAAKFETENRQLTTQKMQVALNDLLKSEKATAIDNGDTIVVMFEKSERYYEIDKNGNIEIFTPYFDKTPGVLAKDSDGKLMIESIEDLVVFSAMVNGGYTDENITIAYNGGVSTVLMRNLDFKSPLSYGDSTTTIYNGYLGVEEENIPLIEALTNIEKYKGFIPIGCASGCFRGTFDGKNYYIRNLSENIDGYAGLFGKIRCAVIKNVSVTGNINSKNYAGAIVGVVEYEDTLNPMHIINCTNYANVSGYNNVGGIVGYTDANCGVITQCENFGNVYASRGNAGGITGYLTNRKNDKFVFRENNNHGLVCGSSNVGGIAGEIYRMGNAIESCINGKVAAVISTSSEGNAGGIAGKAYHTYRWNIL